MDSGASDEPIFDVFVDGAHVASLFDPQFADMFWCSYRVEATDAEGDQIIHDEKTWELVNFTVKDRFGNIPNPHTFSAGYGNFCARNSDRLTFRSLWPPTHP